MSWQAWWRRGKLEKKSSELRCCNFSTRSSEVLRRHFSSFHCSKSFALCNFSFYRLQHQQNDSDDGREDGEDKSVCSGSKQRWKFFILNSITYRLKHEPSPLLGLYLLMLILRVGCAASNRGYKMLKMMKREREKVSEMKMKKRFVVTAFQFNWNSCLYILNWKEKSGGYTR